MSYQSWNNLFGDEIDWLPIELAGRGRRIQEPLYSSWRKMILDLTYQVKLQMNGGPYAFYGHSMGGMIAFEVAWELKRQGVKMPLELFISGKGSPHIPKPAHRIIHNLPEEEFLQRVMNMGGTEEEFLDNPEMKSFFVPIMRQDFKLVETLVLENERTPLGCDITLFFGRDEEWSDEEISGWDEHVEGECTRHYFDGGHFFINEHKSEMVRIMQESILNMMVFDF